MRKNGKSALRSVRGFYVLRIERMNLKIRGLTVNIDENKDLGFLMTNDAIKEFCKYHNIQYAESKGGAVTTMKARYHSAMFKEFWKISTNNNWRKMHHLPMIRRSGNE